MIILIESKEDYIYYLKADAIALFQNWNDYVAYIVNPVWKYERLLRKVEYYKNCKKTKYNLYFYYIYLKYSLLGLLLGFSIPPNTFGPGLSIAHPGTIIVNGSAKIGKNCRIHNCVHIATNVYHPYDQFKDDFVPPVPTIGDNVFIGPCVTIFGKIKIANGTAIGANSVVNKSVVEENITIAGAPARKVSDIGFDKCFLKSTEILDTILKNNNNKQSNKIEDDK